MNVLEKGIRHRPNQTGVIVARPNQYVEDTSSNFFESALKVGTTIIDNLAKQENNQVRADFKEAEKEKERIDGVNRDISATQIKDKIDTQHMEFKSSLSKSDFLNEGALQNGREEWKKGVLDIISSDQIIDVEQKEKLKAYVSGLDSASKMEITGKSFQARKEKMEIDTLNNREDRKIAIGLAIMNGDQAGANRLITADKNDRVALQRLNPKRYNKEWINKEGSDLVVYAGMSVVNKAFNSEMEMYLENPTEENYRVMENNVFKQQREFTNPEFIKNMYGSEHGLEYEEFLEKTRILGDRALSIAKSRGKAKVGAWKKEKDKELNDVMENNSKTYASSRSLEGDPPPIVYAPEGDLMSWGYNKLAKNYLEKNDITIENNQQLFEFLEKNIDNPEVPKPNLNLLGKGNVDMLQNFYKEGNLNEIDNALNSLFGEERTEFLDSYLDKELMEKTEGNLNLKKIEVLTQYDPENKTSQNFREVVEYTNKMQNLGLTRDFTNKIETTNLVKNLSFSKGDLKLDSLKNIGIRDREVSLLTKQISSDINSAITVLAYENMDNKERQKFDELNFDEKQSMISKKINSSNATREKAQSLYESTLDGYLGNLRPQTFNGYSFFADKSMDKDYINNQFKDKIKDELYVETKEGGKLIGSGLKKSRIYMNSIGNGDELELLFGDNQSKVYKIVNGKKEYVRIKKGVYRPDELENDRVQYGYQNTYLGGY